MAEYRYLYPERVQFSDTDMAGIVHFSNFYRYMERAEHAFFRSVGLSIWEDPALFSEDDQVAWPRVHTSCDFHSPLRFQDEFLIELLVEEIRTRAVRYLIRCWKLDGTLVAEGRMAAACVRKDPETGRMKSVPIPRRILSKIAAAPADKLGRHPPVPAEAVTGGTG
jgi:acyl-CoA thioester hydrolase